MLYIVSSALMLFWYLRHGRGATVAGSGRHVTLPLTAIARKPER